MNCTCTHWRDELMDVRQAVVDVCTFQQTTFMASGLPAYLGWHTVRNRVRPC